MTGGEAALASISRSAAAVEQAQRVGDMAAALADARAPALPGCGRIGDQALIAARLLERGQILALHVLDERDLERLAVGELAQHHRHLVQPRALRRAPAPLAGEIS